MSRLSKNIVYNLGGQLSVVIFGLFAVKFIFSDLGADALGIIYFTSMVNALILVVLDLGISATTNREISTYNDTEPDYVRDLIRTGSFFYWTAFAILAVAMYLLAPFFVYKWIHLKTLDSNSAIYVLRILGIASLFALPQSLYVNIFKGIQRMEFNNMVNVAFTIFRQFGTILILAIGGNLYHVIYLYAASFILPIITYILIATRFFPFISFIPGYFKHVAKRNIAFASKLIVQTLLLAVYQQLDKLIISKMLPISVLGFYSFAYGNARKAAIVQNSIAVAAYPSFSSLYGKKDRKQLSRQYKLLQDIICFGNAIIMGVIPFVVLPLFSYLFTPSVGKLLLLPTVLITIGLYINGTIRLPFILSISMGKPEIGIKNDSLSLLVVFPLSIFLIYKFGLIGAGLAIISRYLFAYVYAIPRYARECLGVKPMEWFVHVGRIFLLILLSYGSPWIVLAFQGNFSLVALTVAYLSGTILFVIGTFFLMGNELRQTLQTHFPRLGFFKKVEIVRE